MAILIQCQDSRLYVSDVAVRLGELALLVTTSPKAAIDWPDLGAARTAVETLRKDFGSFDWRVREV